MEHALLCPPSKGAERQELALKVFNDGDHDDDVDEDDGDDHDDDDDKDLFQPFISAFVMI